MNPAALTSVYFLGIGGIGMSALARYFHRRGAAVSGYDRTSTPLTRQLESEGIAVHYTDDPARVPARPDLVVITPAIPADLAELRLVQTRKLPLMKRAAVLGLLTENRYCIAVAGSHGKTTISTMTAHLLHASGKDCTAFLGGISRNYDSNLLTGEETGPVVTEADEYDRSFLHLHPDIAVITAIDPDHLDIYGNHDALLGSFREFAGQVKAGGSLVIKEGVGLECRLATGVSRFTYGMQATADYYPDGLSIRQGLSGFTLVTPEGKFPGMTLRVPGTINIENAVAALAACHRADPSLRGIPAALANYRGVVRRLDNRFEKGGLIYIDDYAHHPAELDACIRSVKQMYGTSRITGIFQPHLFTRTRDFADDFARSLEQLDQVILLDIYPAREKPIPGIDSGMLLEKIRHQNKHHSHKEDIFTLLDRLDLEVVLTLGAGDIDQLAGPMVSYLSERYNRYNI